MSDNESDYYSNSSDSDEESVKAVTKKPLVVNAVKKYGNYIEDDSEPEDDSVTDDAVADEDQEEQPLDDEVEEGEIKEVDEVDDDDAEPEEAEEGDIEIDEEGEVREKQPKQFKPKQTTQLIIHDDDEDDYDDEYEENYLQKFDVEVNRNYIVDFHPECLNHNSDEVAKLSKVIRDESNTIIDPLHRTIPYLTKYEKARILGQRAKQIETGAKPLVKVPENIIDSYVIAELELREKKIPFIIKRPIPGGAFEYWNLRDLENIHF
jgi:DNA-directed RNA polymerase I, II, and III subunit RPABC2